MGVNLENNIININDDKKDNNTDSLNLNLSPDDSSGNKTNVSNSYEESSQNSNQVTIVNSPTPILSRRLKQLETIFSQKLLNINELKTFAWKGVPFGR